MISAHELHQLPFSRRGENSSSLFVLNRWENHHSGTSSFTDSTEARLDISQAQDVCCPVRVFVLQSSLVAASEMTLHLQRD